MRRSGLTALLLLLGAMGAFLVAGGALPAPAGAAKCVDCEGEEPGEEAEAQILTIQVQGPGSVATATKTVCENTGTGLKSCELEVAEGKKVTLTATPASGITFTGWSGACAGTGTCEVTMTSAKSVTATFADTTPPATPTITSPTSEQVIESTTGGSVNVSFHSDSTATSFVCHVDSVLAASCSPLSWNTGNLATGKHMVSVAAKDSAGNTSGTATRSFKVVNLPETTLGGTPTDGAVATTGHTAFTFSSDTGTSYRCTLNGNEIPCASDLNLSAEGEYTLTAAAAISPFGDEAVYYDKTPATRTWTVDFPAVDQVIDLGAGTGAGGSGGSPTVITDPKVNARLVSKWRLEDDQTIFRKLVLKLLPAGAKAVATCTGKGCPFKRKQPKVKGGVADLSALFANRELSPGVLIRLKVSAPGMLGQTIDLKVRAGKPPKVTKR
jgi:hypothetical protein